MAERCVVIGLALGRARLVLGKLRVGASVGNWLASERLSIELPETLGHMSCVMRWHLKDQYERCYRVEDSILRGNSSETFLNCIAIP